MRGMRFMVAGLLVAGMFAIVYAQRQPGGFGGRGGGGVTRLVTNKAVLEDIKASEEQAEKLQEWTRSFRETSAKIREDEGVSFGKGGFGKIDDEMRAKMAKANEKIQAEAYKQLGDVLKKDQIERLKQIERQQLGLNAFTNAEVASALKLTDAQKSSINTVVEDLGKERRELFADLGFGGKGGKGGKGFDREKFQEVQKKAQGLEKDAMAKIVKELDASQQKTWKELVGAPFDVSQLNQFGGFGGKGKGKKKD